MSIEYERDTIWHQKHESFFFPFGSIVYSGPGLGGKYNLLVSRFSLGPYLLS